MTVPKTAKKPQDHKPKDGPGTAKDDTGATREVEFGGHTYTIHPGAIDDIEMMELIADSRNSGDAKVAVMVEMIRLLLGEKYDRFKSEQREVHGKLGAEEIQGFIEAAQQGN